jgi:hypothetical protein
MPSKGRGFLRLVDPLRDVTGRTVVLGTGVTTGCPPPGWFALLVDQPDPRGKMKEAGCLLP